MAKKKISRGLRNNNPGNIDFSPRNKWQGQIGIEVGVEFPRFAQFKDMTYGVRAMAVLLIAYYDRHKCDTVRQIIKRWAPPSENQTGSYIAIVARKIGVTPDQTINLHEYDIMRPLVTAIIEHENGLKSYREAVPDAVIDKGLVMAGIQQAPKPLTKSRTIVGSSVAGVSVAATAAAEVVDQVKDQVEPLADYSDTLRLLFLGLALVGIGLAIYAKISERKRGIS